MTDIPVPTCSTSFLVEWNPNIRTTTKWTDWLTIDKLFLLNLMFTENIKLPALAARHILVWRELPCGVWLRVFWYDFTDLPERTHFFFRFPMIHHYVTNGVRDIMYPVSFHSHKNDSLKTRWLTKLFQEAEDSERGIFGTDTKGVIDLVEWKLFGRKRVLPVWICCADTHSCTHFYSVIFNLCWHSFKYTFVFSNIQFMLTLIQVHIYIQ